LQELFACQMSCKKAVVAFRELSEPQQFAPWPDCSRARRAGGWSKLKANHFVGSFSGGLVSSTFVVLIEAVQGKHARIGIPPRSSTAQAAYWSKSRIERKLGIHRETMARDERLHRAESKRAISSTGDSVVQSGRPGRRSVCDPFAVIVSEKLDAGLSTQRIAHDPSSGHGLWISHDGEERFVKRLGKNTPVDFRRTEWVASVEAQAGFGTSAPILTPEASVHRQTRCLAPFSVTGANEIMSNPIWLAKKKSACNATRHRKTRSPLGVRSADRIFRFQLD
jgi:hypothetical protein